MIRAYIRVSTDSKQLLSLDNQEFRIKQKFEDTGLDIAFYNDSATGRKLRRPGLTRLIKDTQRGDIIVVSELSRLTRNIDDAMNLREWMKREQILLICLDRDENFIDDANLDEYVRTIRSYERETNTLSERISNTMQALSEAGTLRSRPPFGWIFTGKDQDFAELPEQQEVIAKIRALYDLGMGYSPIAKKLNDDGDNYCLQLNKLNPKDKVCYFYAEQVKRILLLDPETRIRTYRPAGPQAGTEPSSPRSPRQPTAPQSSRQPTAPRSPRQSTVRRPSPPREPTSESSTDVESR